MMVGCLIMALTSVVLATIDVILKPEPMRLTIQIILFFEIFIACIPRSEVVWLAQWANQPSRTPRNKNPPLWSGEGNRQAGKGYVECFVH